MWTQDQVWRSRTPPRRAVVSETPDSRLELIATQDLIAELARRHDAMVLGTVKPGRVCDQAERKYNGGLFRCIGLVRYLEEGLDEELREVPKMDEEETI